MKRVRVKLLPTFMLITMCLYFSSITVYGDYTRILMEDTGSNPTGWNFGTNRIWSTSGMDDAPSSGHGNCGNYYYFGDSDKDIEISKGVISKTIHLTESERKQSYMGQLRMKFYLSYYGWSGDDDCFNVAIYCMRDSSWLPIEWKKSASISGDRSWITKTFWDGDVVPSGTDALLIVITAERKSGSDLDVYLDDIYLKVYDNTRAFIREERSGDKLVDQIIDENNVARTLVMGVDNWVNPSDTIKGNLYFNEFMKVCTETGNLNINVLGSGDRIRGYMAAAGVQNGTGRKYSYNDNLSFEYRIPLAGATQMEGSVIKFIDAGYKPTDIFGRNPVPSGPFEYPVTDILGNYGLEGMLSNLDAYKLKLDSAVPSIVTPLESYAEYEPDRTSVDIAVREEDKGMVQSPLTLSYYWKYNDISNTEVTETEKQILLSSTVVPVIDVTNTTYNAKINVPNGDSIPPYQDFRLYVKAQDDARNNSGEYKEYMVRQRDMTPPVITWNKSIHEDGTEVYIDTAEDTLYTTGHTVSFSIGDSESSVEEVKYLWTKEPYNPESDIIIKMVLPGEDGKYVVQGTSSDAPLEGMYYLNIQAVNTTGTSCVASKGFYFDNEGPRVSGSVIYMDGNPASAHYQVSDRALQNKFLYTILSQKNDGIIEYEPIVEPDISEGLRDDGMWKVMELEDTGDTESTANITGVLDKITQSGYYKLVTRYYDEFYNYTQQEDNIQYDFISPHIEVVTAGEPSIFQKNHDFVFEVIDNMSFVDIWGEDFSVNWVNTADSGDVISEIPEIEPQLRRITVRGNEGLNGKYYLRVKAKDPAENTMDETVFIEGSRAEFCFDNSPPEATLACDTTKAARTVRFSYSELKDSYTGVALFRYGISASKDSDPSEWIDIYPALGSGEITYPYEFTANGEWYLSVLLRDTLGNEQIIHRAEPFRIDMTKPSGNIAFMSGYTNKLDVPLQLEIDELKSIERGTFKAIVSGNEDTISSVQPLNWKDITFEKGLAVYSYTVSDADNVVQSVYGRFMDEAGNMSDIYKDAVILDRTAPTGEINYDITEPTKGNVTAALSMADNYAVTLLNNNNVNSYLFNRNGEFEFVLADTAGNKTRVKAVVSNIDRDPPKATVTYVWADDESIIAPRDEWTNKAITAKLQLEDINGCKVLSEGGYTHTFNENGVFIFQFEDTLGNQGSISAEVKNIDKTPPVGNIIYTYSDTAPVTVYLAVYEPVKVTNNEGSFRHVFYDNGTFTYTFEDKAGNTGEATAVADTITSAENYADIMYDDSGRLTNENIDATITTFSDLAIITSPTVTEEVYGPYTYSYTENGDWPVSIRVLSGTEEGSTRTVVGSVYNIDRVPPMAEIYISTEEPTNQNVTATLLPYDDKGKTITITGGKSEHIFEENGTYTFSFTDEAGNTGYKTVTVSNIDKSTPIAGIRYFTEASKENSVFSEVYFPDETEEVKILNNNGLNTFEFVENGVFEFEYADKAGNAGHAAAQVTSLSDSASAGTVEYYIEGTKLADPNAVVTNKNVTAKLVLDEAGGPYTIVNNGGSDTYTFLQNGEFTFVYEDSNGNRGFVKAVVNSIDNEVPKLQILADIVRVTNQDVTVTVSYSDNKGIAEAAHNMEADNTTASEGKLTYICKANKTIQVTVTDTAGNMITKEFIVNYIDKVTPIGTVTYTPGSITNKDVKAVLTLNEPGLILNNSGRMEYTFIQNGEFNFEFEDNAGNKTTKTAYVNWIDKTPPEVSLEYSNTVMTNKPVTVTLKTEVNAVILNNGGASTRTFYTNGEFTFRVMDNAGNEANIKAVVGNIDAEKPQISLNGYAYASILQNEAYTEAGYTASDNVDGDITSKVVVEGSVNVGVPGIYILKYKVTDAVGNSSEEKRTVKVVGTDEIALILNGKLADGEWIIIDDSDINIDCIGNEGSCVIKWAEGKKTQAYFKSEGNITEAKETVGLVKGSWYTFYIQDRERKTKCIQVYINE